MSELYSEIFQEIGYMISDQYCRCGKGKHSDLAKEALQECADEFQANLNDDLSGYLEDVLQELFNYYYCPNCLDFDIELYLGMLCEINSDIVKKLEDSDINIREKLTSLIKERIEDQTYYHELILRENDED